MLSEEVTIKKRVVYDIFMMLGEVGGLNDFLILIFAAFFGLFSGQFLLASLAQKLFRSINSARTKKVPIAPAALSPFSFSACFILAQVCKMGWCLGDKAKHRKALLHGMTKVEN